MVGRSANEPLSEWQTDGYVWFQANSAVTYSAYGPNTLGDKGDWFAMRSPDCIAVDTTQFMMRDEDDFVIQGFMLFARDSGEDWQVVFEYQGATLNEEVAVNAQTCHTEWGFKVTDATYNHAWGEVPSSYLRMDQWRIIASLHPTFVQYPPSVSYTHLRAHET